MKGRLKVGPVERPSTYNSEPLRSIFKSTQNSSKPYDRFESIVLLAFSEAPQMMLPNLDGPKSDRVYELRSYEVATEKYYLIKVKMFNAGGEVALFKRVNFNAVFYGEVITGSHMPNLMYMTSFANQADRDAHRKAFVDSPEWTVLKADEQYKNNTSKNTQYFLYPTENSDILVRLF